MKIWTPIIAVVFALPLILAGCGQSADDDYAAAEQAFQEGNYEKAIGLFTKAAETSDNPAIYGNRANCYSYLGDLDAALEDYNTAIEKALELSNDANDPRLAYLYYNRGFACERGKRYEQAIRDYEKTISLDEEYADVKNNLAWVLATCPNETLRDPQRAMTLAEAECEKTDWKNASLLDTIAAAYAAAGDFSQAIERQEQAIKLIDDAETKKSFSERLELYRRNKPFIESGTND